MKTTQLKIEDYLNHRKSGNGVGALDQEICEIKARMDTLEKVLVEKEKEINCLTQKLKIQEEKSIEKENKFRAMIVKMSETIVKDTTETVVSLFTKKQDDIEKQNEAKLDALSNQLAMIFSILQPAQVQN